MPIYEYICKNCGKRFDELVLKLEGAEDIKCPQCGEKKCVKVPSVFSASSCSQVSSFS